MILIKRTFNKVSVYYWWIPKFKFGLVHEAEAYYSYNWNSTANVTNWSSQTSVIYFRI